MDINTYPNPKVYKVDVILLNLMAPLRCPFPVVAAAVWLNVFVATVAIEGLHLVI